VRLGLIIESKAPGFYLKDMTRAFIFSSGIPFPIIPLNQCQIVPLSSVDKILRLCFTTENTEIAEFSLFSFKLTALSACSAVKLA